MKAAELKHLMRTKGWSNADLARALGVSVSTVVKWRGAQHPIPKASAIAIRTLSRQAAA